MKSLNSKYRQILWANIILLGGGIGYMVYLKWGNPLYAAGAALVIGLLEYFVMGYSLANKQKKEEEG